MPGTPMSGTPMRGALRASGLRTYWVRNYPCLREPGARAAAEDHVLGTLRTLPLPYRAGYAVALRALPVAYRLRTGRSLRRASPDQACRGMAALTALPGFTEVVRSSTALALLGALDRRTDGSGRSSGSGSGRSRSRSGGSGRGPV
ncbi:hypothetical protein [Streptomyces sp. SID3212]|uniref:hypothetical protein n=1 Tax=Streptomyces sp. SID3212 TaxID=2690259 RepID=UPI00136865A0|nr:hypothetical protein [Streptomyces sp. SID3212]MYV53468.1 hypothetical protein [Streptomyces sp. SID3212]